MKYGVKFLVKKIANLNYKRMFDRIDDLHKLTGKGKISLFCDIVYTGIKYQAGYEDYAFFKFYDVPRKNRETYLTRGINNQLVKMLNDPEYMYYTDDKSKFHEVYKEFAARDSIYLKEATKEEFLEFAARHEYIMIKPFDDGSGIGIEKLAPKDYASYEELYDYIMSTNSLLVEEVITQHDDMAKLCPTSVNTLRIVTIRHPETDEISIPFAAMRAGTGKPMDNLYAGGVLTILDENTGVALFPAQNEELEVFTHHPVTGTPIEGFQVPFWEETIEFIKKAALVTPQLRYVGWDVAITKNGPLLIEGNAYPANQAYQMPAMNPGKIGRLPKFEKASGIKFYK